MAIAATIPAEREHYLNQDYDIRSWLFTTDHKRIALLYLVFEAKLWNAPGLEWMAASPPPTLNFDETPVITWEAYNYAELHAGKEVLVER